MADRQTWQPAPDDPHARQTEWEKARKTAVESTFAENDDAQRRKYEAWKSHAPGRTADRFFGVIPEDAIPHTKLITGQDMAEQEARAQGAGVDAARHAAATGMVGTMVGRPDEWYASRPGARDINYSSMGRRVGRQASARPGGFTVIGSTGPGHTSDLGVVNTDAPGKFNVQSAFTDAQSVVATPEEAMHFLRAEAQAVTGKAWQIGQGGRSLATGRQPPAASLPGTTAHTGDLRPKGVEYSTGTHPVAGTTAQTGSPNVQGDVSPDVMSWQRQDPAAYRAEVSHVNRQMEAGRMTAKQAQRHLATVGRAEVMRAQGADTLLHTLSGTEYDKLMHRWQGSEDLANLQHRVGQLWEQGADARAIRAEAVKLLGETGITDRPGLQSTRLDTPDPMDGSVGRLTPNEVRATPTSFGDELTAMSEADLNRLFRDSMTDAETMGMSRLDALTKRLEGAEGNALRHSLPPEVQARVRGQTADLMRQGLPQNQAQGEALYNYLRSQHRGNMMDPNMLENEAAAMWRETADAGARAGKGGSAYPAQRVGKGAIGGSLAMGAAGVLPSAAAVSEYGASQHLDRQIEQLARSKDGPLTVFDLHGELGLDAIKADRLTREYLYDMGLIAQDVYDATE